MAENLFRSGSGTGSSQKLAGSATLNVTTGNFKFTVPLLPVTCPSPAPRPSPAPCPAPARSPALATRPAPTTCPSPAPCPSPVATNLHLTWRAFFCSPTP
jgi:hypothetical protein